MNKLSPWKRPWYIYKNGKMKCPKHKINKWFDTPHSTISSITTGARTKIKLVQFNPGSRAHIKIWLQKLYNINSNTFTPKGNAKWSAEVFDDLANQQSDIQIKETLLSLRDYLKNVKDSGFLYNGDNALLKLYNPGTKAIHGSVDTLGTTTARATHSKPNMSQTNTDKEYRELFIAPKGYKVIGADQSALEVRTLAHYLYEFDKGDYINVVLNKDVHTHNQHKAGLPTRDSAKTFFFAFLYGSGAVVRGNSLWNEEIASTFEYTDKEYNDISQQIDNRAILINDVYYYPLKKDLMVKITPLLIKQGIYGKRIGDSFTKELTGLQELIDKVKIESNKTGGITTIDGRYIDCPSGHTALNYLLQSSGSIIVKQWMINTYQSLLKLSHLQYGKDYWQVGYFHDELEYIAKEEYSEQIKTIIEEASIPLQEQFNLNLPFVAEGKIGDSWYDVH